MAGDLFHYTPLMFSEAPGKDRDDAIRRLFARFDATSSRRRKPAAQRYRVVRVRRLGRGWWSIAWRRRSA